MIKAKAIYALIATLLFTLSLIVVYLLHVHLFQVNVVFYSAILDGAIATVLTALVLFKFRGTSLVNDFEKIQLIISWLMMGYIFAISAPTVIDRSLSFYLLEKLNQRGGAITQDGFEYIFTHEYVKEHRLIDIRLTEQLHSGTITIENGCVRLTKRGASLAKFSRFFRQYFLPSQRLIMGEYTDDLKNPFREDTPHPDYECTTN